MSDAIEQWQIWVDNTRIMKPTVLMKGKKLLKYCWNIFWLRVDIVAAKSDSTRCKKTCIICEIKTAFENTSTVEDTLRKLN